MNMWRILCPCRSSFLMCLIGFFLPFLFLFGCYFLFTGKWIYGAALILVSFLLSSVPLPPISQEFSDQCSKELNVESSLEDLEFRLHKCWQLRRRPTGEMEIGTPNLNYRFKVLIVIEKKTILSPQEVMLREREEIKKKGVLIDIGLVPFPGTESALAFEFYEHNGPYSRCLTLWHKNKVYIIQCISCPKKDSRELFLPVQRAFEESLRFRS